MYLFGRLFSCVLFAITEGTGAEPAGESEKGECVNEWVKAVCCLSSELLFAQTQTQVNEPPFVIWTLSPFVFSQLPLHL